MKIQTKRIKVIKLMILQFMFQISYSYRYGFLLVLDFPNFIVFFLILYCCDKFIRYIIFNSFVV